MPQPQQHIRLQQCLILNLARLGIKPSSSQTLCWVRNPLNHNGNSCLIFLKLNWKWSVNQVEKRYWRQSIVMIFNQASSIPTIPRAPSCWPHVALLIWELRHPIFFPINRKGNYSKPTLAPTTVDHIKGLLMQVLLESRNLFSINNWLILKDQLPCVVT